MTSKPRFLMCPPDLYDVEYVINPWMEGNVRRSSLQLAAEQWQGLKKLIERHAVVELIPPQPGLPDMVFTANAGIVVGRSLLRHDGNRLNSPRLRALVRQGVVPLPKVAGALDTLGCGRNQQGTLAAI